MARGLNEWMEGRLYAVLLLIEKNWKVREESIASFIIQQNEVLRQAARVGFWGVAPNGNSEPKQG